MSSNTKPSPRVHPEIARRKVDIPGRAAAAADWAGPRGEGKKLIVGRDICLNGEITACDKLIVEGQVQASLTESQTIEIAATGHFKGSAEVESADISGLFEGKLTVRRRLTVRATGRVKGTVRYGEIEVERGGVVSGDICTVAEAEAGGHAGSETAAGDPVSLGGETSPRSSEHG